MKGLGYLLIGIGAIYLVIAFNMDVSISTPSTYVPGVGSIGGGEVANLDLMARRQNHLIVASLITLIGALMAIFGKDAGENTKSFSSATPEPKEKTFEGERSLSSDPYRLWLADTYGIEKNELFDQFVFQEKTYDTLDQALLQAHSIEEEANARRLADQERRAAEAAEKLEEQRLASEEAKARWQDQKPRVIVGSALVVVLAILSYFVFRESPQEREARLEREREARMELIERTEETFGVKIPVDATGLETLENDGTYSYLCDEQQTGRLLKFRTNKSEKDVKEMFAESLGEGEAMYGSLADQYDWSWRKDGIYYELSSFEEKPPIDVHFCMVE